MNILKHKIIVYDADCPLCRRLKQYAVRWKVVADNHYCTIDELPAQHAARVDRERFRSEMALVDTATGSTLYGIEGLSAVFALRYPLLRPLLALSLVQVVLRAVYSIIAPNRYVLSTPPARPFVCACAPVVSTGTRLRYIIPAHLLSIAAIATVAIAIRPLVPEIPLAEHIARVLLITGTGWALYTAIAAVAHPRLFIEHWAHLSSVMWRGTLFLLPIVVLAAFSVYSVAFLFFCTIISSVVMRVQHLRRIKALGLSPWWGTLWTALLYGGALFWIALFFQ